MRCPTCNSRILFVRIYPTTTSIQCQECGSQWDRAATKGPVDAEPEERAA